MNKIKDMVDKISSYIEIVVLTFKGKFSKDNIELRKQINYNNVKKVIIPDEIKINPQNIHINGDIDDKYMRYINIYIERLLSNINNSYLDIFMSNIENLDIYQSEVRENKKIAVIAEYVPVYGEKTNYINISGDELTILYHELNHMSSTPLYEKEIIDDNSYKIKIKSGFLRIMKTYDLEDKLIKVQSIGNALNEGVTELITQILFPEIERNHYELLVYLARFVSIALGFDKLCELYFKADFDELVSELCKYADYDTVITYIYNLDLIMRVRNTSSISPIDKVNYKTAVTSVRDFSEMIYITKKINQLKDKSINEDEFVSSINKFIGTCTVDCSLDLKGDNIYFFELDRIINLISKIMKDNNIDDDYINDICFRLGNVFKEEKKK